MHVLQSGNVNLVREKASSDTAAQRRHRRKSRRNGGEVTPITKVGASFDGFWYLRCLLHPSETYSATLLSRTK